MEIPQYPDTAPIDRAMRPLLHPSLADIPDGVSEFTFAGLYLFRRTYQYQLSCLDDQSLLISGTREGKAFAMLPFGLPRSDDQLLDLIDRFDYIKGLSERVAQAEWTRIEQIGLEVIEDRDNFDYLYQRTDLATLSGRKFHKKRNHINAFVSNHTFDEYPMGPEHIEDARQILESWQSHQDDRADYDAARDALDLFSELELTGHIVYVEGVPGAYALGEPLMAGRACVVHFEKALEEYRGLYQYINKAFAAALPERYELINREQDLGDEGLRQSKMTYRPVGFVRKYRVARSRQEAGLPDPPAETESADDRAQDGIDRANQASA